MREEIATVANALFPEEACGFVLTGGRVVSCSNVAGDPSNAFQIHQGQAEDWWMSGQVVGLWHSHPRDSAVPSQEDEASAVPGLDFIVYSVPDEDLGVYRSDENGRLWLIRMEGPT